MQPLTHARIGYDSITKRATITASGALTGYPASSAVNDLTFAFWSAGLPATWEAELAEAEICNYFGIAAHTLWSNHAMVVMQAWLDDAWRTLSVLTTTGDLWRFDGDFYGERGAAPGTTVGTLRRGVAVDGLPIKPFYNAGATDVLGEQDSKFGIHSLTVEPAVTNLFPENVRNGGDTNEDMTDFDASDATYSTNRAVSGTGSILVTAGGGLAVLQTDPVAISGGSTYTTQIKLMCPVTIGAAVIEIHGDVSGLLGSVQFDDVPPGVWTLLQHTEATAGGDSTVHVILTIDDGACYVDEMQLELGAIAFSWVDGASAAGDLAHQPEILQQIADDCTVNFWAKMPDAAFGQAFFTARALGGTENTLIIWNPANANSISVSTSDAEASADNMDHTFTWGRTWHMDTVVLRPGISGAHNKLLYIDGKLATSKETTDLPTWSGIGRFNLGHVASSARLGSDGESLMDDLTVLNRAASSVEVKGWYDDDAAMDLAAAGLPSHADDRPIMTLVEEQTSHRFRLLITGQSTPVIGVIRMGQALEMERPLYGGHSPINLSRITVVRPNVSERGQWLGRSTIRSGAGGSWSWSNLTAAWVRRYLDPFVEAARTLPFFVLWRPETFPGESAYCWTMQDPAPPVNSGPRDLMTFTIDAQGLGNE